MVKHSFYLYGKVPYVGAPVLAFRCSVCSKKITIDEALWRGLTMGFEKHYPWVEPRLIIHQLDLFGKNFPCQSS